MPIYSRDELVEELTSFYKLLIRLYLPVSSLNIPPKDGWPEITAERYAFLKKNDTVIDLMKHLPYIHQDSIFGAMNTIYPMATCVQYNGPYLQKTMSYEHPNKEAVDPVEEFTVIPAHVLTIAMETSGADGFWWFADTERGTITLMGEGTKGTNLSIVITFLPMTFNIFLKPSSFIPSNETNSVYTQVY